MRRSPFVVLGTVAGLVGVLSFHTSRTHLVIPSASPAAGGTAAGGRSGATSPSGPASAVGPAGAAGSGPSPTTTPAGTTPPTTAVGGTRTATGADTQYPYGDLAVSVTVDGSRITGVDLVTLNDTDPRSASIDQYATPILRNQVLAADGVDISGVSGATFTSQAYVDSVQSALDKLGVK